MFIPPSLIRPLTIVMVPSVSGGIGHISRTASLARALLRLEPSINIEFLLDTDRLRPFNIEATLQMGFRPRLLPSRDRDSRNAVVRAYLGHADVVVDDVSRYLIPLRQIVPQAGWVTIAMHPIGDELFMDWPLLAQTDAVIWAYPPLVAQPPELSIVANKVVQTGPFLDTDAVPSKEQARRILGLAQDELIVLYAPRGFPFGVGFGHQVIRSLFGALSAMQNAGSNIRLVLLAVSNPEEINEILGLNDGLPGWVEIHGVVKPSESLLYTRAADVVIAEGTSTMHEGAALRTPLMLIPGPIQEALRLATALHESGAAALLYIADVAISSLMDRLSEILSSRSDLKATIERAHALVTGGGGVVAAANLVLQIAAKYSKAHTPSTCPKPELAIGKLKSTFFKD